MAFKDKKPTVFNKLIDLTSKQKALMFNMKSEGEPTEEQILQEDKEIEDAIFNDTIKQLEFKGKLPSPIFNMGTPSHQLDFSSPASEVSPFQLGIPTTFPANMPNKATGKPKGFVYASPDDTEEEFLKKPAEANKIIKNIYFESSTALAAEANEKFWANQTKPPEGTYGAIKKTTHSWWNNQNQTLVGQEPKYTLMPEEQSPSNTEELKSEYEKYYVPYVGSDGVLKSVSPTAYLPQSWVQPEVWAQKKLAEQFETKKGPMEIKQNSIPKNWVYVTSGGSLSSAVMWTFQGAKPILDSCQALSRTFGYHMCLGGGVLNKGVSTKDLDIYFLPLDNNDSIPNPKGLLSALQALFFAKFEQLGKPYEGNSLPYIFKGKLVQVNGKRIDVFVMGKKKLLAVVEEFLKENNFSTTAETYELSGDNIIHFTDEATGEEEDNLEELMEVLESVKEDEDEDKDDEEPEGLIEDLETPF